MRQAQSEKMSDQILCPRYLDYIRALPCLVKNRECAGPIDADHLQARGWSSYRQVDFYALPLCRFHHSQRHQVGNIRFAALHAIDLWRAVARLIVEWIRRECPQATAPETP
jgi:hypothetical protein